MTDANPSETESAIMKLLALDALTWRDVQTMLGDIHPDWIDAAMLRLECCGAIRLNRRTGRYEKYD